jgi:hypothetical protein
MLTRSQLRHTAVDNGLAPLFEPHQREATRRVLTGEAAPDEFPALRERLQRWPLIREHVEANLVAFERDYTPFPEALELLRALLPPKQWSRVAACHRARVHEYLQIGTFVAAVRSTVRRFDVGLRAVSLGAMTVGELAQLHAEVVDAYRTR